MKNIKTCYSYSQAESLSNGENAAILGGVGGDWAKQSKMPSASVWLCAKCELVSSEMILPC